MVLDDSELNWCTEMRTLNVNKRKINPVHPFNKLIHKIFIKFHGSWMVRLFLCIFFRSTSFNYSESCTKITQYPLRAHFQRAVPNIIEFVLSAGKKRDLFFCWIFWNAINCCHPLHKNPVKLNGNLLIADGQMAIQSLRFFLSRSVCQFFCWCFTYNSIN